MHTLVFSVCGEYILTLLSNLNGRPSWVFVTKFFSMDTKETNDSVLSLKWLRQPNYFFSVSSLHIAYIKLCCHTATFCNEHKVLRELLTFSFKHLFLGTVFLKTNRSMSLFRWKSISQTDLFPLSSCIWGRHKAWFAYQQIFCACI